MKNIAKQKQSLKKWFDATADRYDSWGQQEKFSEYEKGMQWISDGLRVELNAAKKLMLMRKGDRVLDVATGTGNYLIAAAQRGAACYGIDLSEKILEVARAKVKKLGLKNVKELKIADADKLPYENNFFDWVTCIGMFDYYSPSHSKNVLKEFKRVLKSNGKMLIDFCDASNQQSWEFKKKSATVNHKVYLYSQKQIKDVVKSAGLRILKQQVAGPQVQVLLKSV